MNALRKGLVSAIVLSLSLGAGAAFAQTTPGAAPTTSAPAAKTMKPMKPMVKHVHKVSASKSCAAQGHQKKLHGKAFSRFEANCMHKGGA